jgi:trans-aconitate methyltransferase
MGPGRTPFCARSARLPERGRCLAVGDGEGRNGVWLAEQGLDVLSVDVSAIGLRKARTLAQTRGVKLETQCIDLTQWTWPQDASTAWSRSSFHFPPAHRTRMHRAMYAALRPGGVLILEAFTPAQLQYRSGGPPIREMSTRRHCCVKISRTGTSSC